MPRSSNCTTVRLVVGSLEFFVLFVLRDQSAMVAFTPPDSSWDTSNRPECSHQCSIKPSSIFWFHEARKTFVNAIAATVVVVVLVVVDTTEY